jgi:predicted NBD/HSP70 family sugar kinase
MQRLQKREIRVLQAIFAGRYATRTRIARHTRLSLVKVSSILSRLRQEGYIEQAGRMRSRTGRPSVLYRLRPELGCVVGVSFGLVDRFQIVAMDAAKRIILRRECPLELPADPANHGRALLDRLVEELDRMRGFELPAELPLMALGLALPGMVDTRRGTWLLGLQLTGITHVPVVSVLGERLGLPVLIDDVVRCLAMLELHHGQGRRSRNFVLVYLGQGMGAAIVIDHRIYRGHHGLAGEIGHLEHADNNYRCSCSNVGCLETMVSATGIQRVFRDRLAEGVISSLQREPAEPGLGDILAAARAGDRFAQSTLQEIGRFLGDSCAILIKMFNPQQLIISGTGAMFRDFFQEPVEQVIRRHVLPEMLADYRTVFADYEPFQEAQGAALAAMGHYLDRQRAHPSESLPAKG